MKSFESNKDLSGLNTNNNIEPHLTTENRLSKLNQGRGSSDGFTGQSSWVPFVRRTLSRQTMRWNSNIFIGEKV